MKKPDADELAALNVRIAEFSGWTQVKHDPVFTNRHCIEDVYGVPPGCEDSEPCPDFTGSLDAIHGAENSLISTGNLAAIYNRELTRVCGNEYCWIWFAEAWQRAVALDRVISATRGTK